ncbi:nuclear transport factor 2 family protein [Nocardia terrae]|nr:nuclear transport factor 2 family protein [Nocardia terrae]
MNADENTVCELFAAIDAGRIETATGLLTQDVHFRFGNAEPTIGRDAFAANAAAMGGVLASISHEMLAVWTTSEPDAAVVCEMAVTYSRHDGSQLKLPCANVFRLRSGLIADYRIYMDINPVFAAAATEPE